MLARSFTTAACSNALRNVLARPAFTSTLASSSSRLMSSSSSAAAGGDHGHHAPRRSPYPVPPVADTNYDRDGAYRHDLSNNWPVTENCDFTTSHTEGVCVVKFTKGAYTGEEVVLANMVSTLEWALPSPPPLHCFDESPIVKVHPLGEDVAPKTDSKAASLADEKRAAAWEAFLANNPDLRKSLKLN